MENLAYKNAVEAATKWGWHVFPVHTAERVADDAPVECSCQRPDCTQMGKHPRTRNGLTDATDDLEQLATWHRQWPDANWAVRTGPESGIWAIDWDGDEGLANRRALIKELEASLGDTRQVRSDGGGLHDIYAWPADDTVVPSNSRKLATAADVRGKGGYILLPGSRHKSGRVYEVVSDVEPKQAPTSLVTRVLQASKAAGSGPTTAMIPEGQRNDALTSEAGKLRRIGFDTPEIDAALQAVNGRRCNPPLPITEVSKIAASVGKYPAGNGTVPSSRRPYRDSRDDGQTPFPSIETEDLMRSDQGALKVVDFGTAGRPAPPAWVVKHLIPAGYTSMLYGMGGSGKSLLAMHLAQSIAAGRERWFSYEVEPARVLYLDFELEYSVQGNRAFDVAVGMGLDDPPEGLKYVPVASTDAATAFEFAYAACQEHDCDLVVVDSVGPAMLGDAELAKDVIGFLNTYIKPFNALGKAVLMIDHQAKVIVGEKAKAKLPFGSVYKFNLSRSVIQVTGSQVDGGIVATFDQKKSNFGPVQDEFKAQLEFSRKRIEVRDPDPGNLDNTTTSDKIMQALEDGPKYPAEIAEVLGIKTIKTVKNAITDLKKAQKVEPTGVTDQNGAQQVRLTAAYDSKTILRNDAPKLERNDNHAA